MGRKARKGLSLMGDFRAIKSWEAMLAWYFPSLLWSVGAVLGG